MRNRFIVALLVGMITLAGAAVASAGSITITPNFPSNVWGVWISLNAGAAYSPYGVASYTVVVTEATGMGPLVTNQTFETFCVDLTSPPDAANNSTYDFVSNWDLNAPSPHKAKAAWLLNHFFANGPESYGQAAYQIAIWEALYEEGDELGTTDGTARFIVDEEAGSDTGIKANALLSLAEPGSDAGWLRNFDSENGDTQDFGAPAAVPDGGATLILLGGALMGLGALRRKLRG